MLKYQRLGASVSEILATDAACCLGVHEKFLVLGTQSGAPNDLLLCVTLLLLTSNLGAHTRSNACLGSEWQ